MWQAWQRALPTPARAAMRGAAGRAGGGDESHSPLIKKTAHRRSQTSIGLCSHRRGQHGSR
eukprot:10431178-Alexandrium_andersonii.AAC.1